MSSSVKSEVKSAFKDKSVLLIGAAGSVGKQMIDDILELGVDQLLLFDNNETELFNLWEKYGDKVKIFVGDITNRELMFRVVKHIDIVLHLAALKHVHIGEICPDSIVEVNIRGLQNVLDAALSANVERFVFTSSDKAVNPTNVMGTSKLMGERLVRSIHHKRKSERTIFCSTRFGNVIGSRGGVFNTFKNQASESEPLTLTDKKMTRFIMSLPQASKLVLESVSLAVGGEVFVTKMPTVRIEDLAIVLRKQYAPKNIEPEDIPIIEIGAKPGEKMFEELVVDHEIQHSFEIEDFIVVLPPFKTYDDSKNRLYLKDAKPISKEYNSQKEIPLSVEELHTYLEQENLLEE